jgi:hypothetical protein
MPDFYKQKPNYIARKDHELRSLIPDELDHLDHLARTRAHLLDITGVIPLSILEKITLLKRDPVSYTLLVLQTVPSNQIACKRLWDWCDTHTDAIDQEKFTYFVTLCKRGLINLNELEIRIGRKEVNDLVFKSIKESSVKPLAIEPKNEITKKRAEKVVKTKAPDIQTPVSVELSPDILTQQIQDSLSEAMARLPEKPDTLLERLKQVGLKAWSFLTKRS